MSGDSAVGKGAADEGRRIPKHTSGGSGKYGASGFPTPLDVVLAAADEEACRLIAEDNHDRGPLFQRAERIGRAITALRAASTAPGAPREQDARMEALRRLEFAAETTDATRLQEFDAIVPMLRDALGSSETVAPPERETLNPTPDLRGWLRKWAREDLDMGAEAEANGGATIGVDIDFRERVVREICAPSATEQAATREPEAWEIRTTTQPENRHATFDAEVAEQERRIGSTVIPLYVAILTDRTGGDRRPLTLRALRARLEAGETVDLFDIGGCGCFAGSDAA